MLSQDRSGFLLRLPGSPVAASGARSARAQCSRGAPRGWEERRGLDGGERGQEAARHRFGALQAQHGRLAAGESHSAG